MTRPLAVAVMAAGKGTRMNNPSMAKVMYPIEGRPMVEYVVDTARDIGASRIIVIVGWQKESVREHLAGRGVEFVDQVPQLGTGHAVMQTRKLLEGFAGDLLVLSGDVPLLRAETCRALLERHRASGAAATLLTCMMADPAGYGRVIRTPEGGVRRIVEEKDATEEEKAVEEVNTGIYVFDAKTLFEALEHLTPTNAQKEYYLTDVFGWLRTKGLPIAASPTGAIHEVMGINTPAQLEEARRAMAERRGG
ncbi:MAG: NTP transferase domain-containing protein [Bacteroidota bacterium]